jgi:hypothetical protein
MSRQTIARVREAAQRDAGVRLSRMTEAAHIYTAFRQRDEGLAQQIGEYSAATLQGALSQITHGLAHKDTLFVTERRADMRVPVLHCYRVRKGEAVYRRNPDTGLSERVAPLKLDRLFSLPVDAFTPTRPFDAFADCPVGVDRGLIEGGVA